MFNKVSTAIPPGLLSSSWFTPSVPCFSELSPSSSPSICFISIEVAKPISGIQPSATNAKGHIKMKDKTMPVMIELIAIRKLRIGSPENVWILEASSSSWVVMLPTLRLSKKATSCLRRAEKAESRTRLFNLSLAIPKPQRVSIFPPMHPAATITQYADNTKLSCLISSAAQSKASWHVSNSCIKNAFTAVTSSSLQDGITLNRSVIVWANITPQAGNTPPANTDPIDPRSMKIASGLAI
mmetsp:Transcript_15579/g.22585  ORF Transcript_15579/g.22585 Transcript_15579/m.22585 type:complete len:240 (+) Transcript_15579:677-1396(+)